MRDSDEDFEETLVEPGAGHATPLDAAPLANLILDMTADATRLAVMLCEADEDDYVLVAVRLELLKRSIASLPDEPRPRKRVGFKAPVKRKRKRRS